MGWGLGQLLVAGLVVTSLGHNPQKVLVASASTFVQTGVCVPRWVLAAGGNMGTYLQTEQGGSVVALGHLQWMHWAYGF